MSQSERFYGRRVRITHDDGSTYHGTIESATKRGDTQVRLDDGQVRQVPWHQLADSQEAA